MTTPTYACRIVFNNGDPVIKVYTDYAVEKFRDEVRKIAVKNGYRGNGIWYCIGTWDNVTKLMIWAGTHYPGSAVYEGNGVETPILPPGVRCRKCGRVYTQGLETEHARDCDG